MKNGHLFCNLRYICDKFAPTTGADDRFASVGLRIENWDAFIPQFRAELTRYATTAALADYLEAYGETPGQVPCKQQALPITT